jgi:hypothetical protein
MPNKTSRALSQSEKRRSRAVNASSRVPAGVPYNGSVTHVVWIMTRAMRVNRGRGEFGALAAHIDSSALTPPLLTLSVLVSLMHRFGVLRFAGRGSL